MIEQHTLFGEAPYVYEPAKSARKADPKPSKVAASVARAFAGTHAECIFAAMKAHKKPITAKELVPLTGLELAQVYRRRHELVHAGLIRVTDQERDGCNVWELVP